MSERVETCFAAWCESDDLDPYDLTDEGLSQALAQFHAELTAAPPSAMRSTLWSYTRRNLPSAAPVTAPMKPLPLVLSCALLIVSAFYIGHTLGRSSADRYYFSTSGRFVFIGDRVTGAWRRERMPLPERSPEEAPNAY